MCNPKATKSLELEIPTPNKTKICNMFGHLTVLYVKALISVFSVLQDPQIL